MTTRIQDKWLAAIEVALLDPAPLGADVAEHAQWANTGNLYLQQGVRTFVTVTYQFNDGGVRLELTGPAVDRLGLVDSPPEYRYERGAASWYALDYADGPRFEGFLDVCRRAATEMGMLTLEQT